MFYYRKNYQFELQGNLTNYFYHINFLSSFSPFSFSIFNIGTFAGFDYSYNDIFDNNFNNTFVEYAKIHNIGVIWGLTLRISTWIRILFGMRMTFFTDMDFQGSIEFEPTASDESLNAVQTYSGVSSSPPAFYGSIEMFFPHNISARVTYFWLKNNEDSKTGTFNRAVDSPDVDYGTFVEIHLISLSVGYHYDIQY